MKIKYETLKKIESFVQSYGECRLTTSYSGRGMGGQTCVGFSGSAFDMGMGLGQWLAIGANDDYEDVIRNYGSDSMGRSTIIYFPDLTCDDAPSGDDDGDEE